MMFIVANGLYQLQAIHCIYYTSLWSLSDTHSDTHHVHYNYSPILVQSIMLISIAILFNALNYLLLNYKTLSLILLKINNLPGCWIIFIIKSIYILQNKVQIKPIILNSSKINLNTLCHSNILKNYLLWI